MSRIIAIDYGRKRTGIAVSDTLQMIANGLTTVPTHQLLSFCLIMWPKNRWSVF